MNLKGTIIALVIIIVSIVLTVVLSQFVIPMERLGRWNHVVEFVIGFSFILVGMGVYKAVNKQ